MSKTKRQLNTWPEPLVVHPTATTHTHTIILLHGRGSNAERFGRALLAARSSSSSQKTLAEHFPSVRFIFPTAKKRRSTVLKRIPIHQWFDNFSLDDPSRRQDLQYEGLRETSAFIAGLVRHEAAALPGGAQRVIIGGLSQGCAAALHVLLNFGGGGGGGGEEEERLGGFIGMSGWLPFAETLDPSATPDENETEGEQDNIFFGSDDGDDDDLGVKQQDDHHQEDDNPPLHELQRTAANTARDIASLPPLPADQPVPFPRTPVFLGHGRHDEKVSVALGGQARRVLRALGCDRVAWRDYDEGHWYKVPEEIDDVVEFLKSIGVQGS